MLNGESDKLGKRRKSKSELAGVDDDGGLTIEWEFELRKEEGSCNGEKKRTPVDLLYIFPNSVYKVHSRDY